MTRRFTRHTSPKNTYDTLISKNLSFLIAKKNKTKNQFNLKKKCLYNLYMLRLYYYGNVYLLNSQLAVEKKSIKNCFNTFIFP